MFNKLECSFSALLIAAMLISGCNTVSAPSAAKIYSFLNVNLGMSTAETAAVLGEPLIATQDTTFDASGRIIYVPGSYYCWYLSMLAIVRFVSDEAAYIQYLSDAKSIEGISVGDSLSSLRTRLGEPSEIKGGSINLYADRNLYFTVFSSEVQAIGIYDPDKRDYLF